MDVDDGEENGVSSLDCGKVKELWDPTLHLVTLAGWDIPMNFWKTACGWPFAANRSEAAFCYKNDLTKKKCRKCIKNRSKRDAVKEVEVWRLKRKGVADFLDGGCCPRR